MAGFAPPPTALMAQMVVLSTKLVAGYPQLSVVIVAGGIVMPGVHEGAPETALQLFPMLPPLVAQFEPLQQRLGSGGLWGVHVRPGAQLPLESQRQPWVPMMHVVGAPEPTFMPPSLPTETIGSPPSPPPPSVPDCMPPTSVPPQPVTTATRLIETPISHGKCTPRAIHVLFI